MKFGLIGEHLPHSFSKDIHSLIGRFDKNEYDYAIKELRPDEVGSFLDKKDFCGINVTIPYKETVIPYLYEIDKVAKDIGAVNTAVNRGGKLFGYNTDYYGLRDLIIHTGIDLGGKKVLILGTGGTSKTARYVCRDLGADRIVVVSRSKSGPDNTDISCEFCTYETAYSDHTDADVIINTTPVGMYPKTGVSAIDISAFDGLSGAIDVIYNPLNTEFVLDCKKRGIKCAGGLYMLVTQAVYAYAFFFGKEPEDLDLESIIGKVYGEIYKDKLNVVLTGMPGSGKSTVGRILSENFNKEFVDTDDLIIKRDGRQITDIFSLDGEPFFRDLESNVIKEISQSGGHIIATGGGAILRPENVDALRSNGIIVFIDRPLEALIPTSDRPTASDVDMLKKRYEERYDTYCNTCDIHIDADADINEVSHRILDRFYDIIYV